MTDQPTYTISQVVDMLSRQYPELTVISLHFLEKKGLLTPQRTQGRHRLYSDEDVARIRLIKDLQSRRYYPLDVIRHMLVKLERAKDVDAEMAFLESLYSPLTYDPQFVPLTREQLAERSGLSPVQLARLEEMGLLFPQTNGNGRRLYHEDDLKIAELVAHELPLGP